MKKTSFIFFWGPVIFYCAALFMFSAWPPPLAASSAPHSDKIAHFIAYAGLGWLFFRGFKSLNRPWSLCGLIFVSSLAGALYGLSDEIHQFFVPCRNADVFDVLADALGSTFGAWLFPQMTTRFQGDVL